LDFLKDMNNLVQLKLDEHYPHEIMETDLPQGSLDSPSKFKHLIFGEEIINISDIFNH
jgi:hypothetical protein